VADIQVCAFHSDEGIRPERVADEAGSLRFTCPRTKGHPTEGTYTWLSVPTPPGLEGVTGLAAELGLHTELPSVIADFGGHWVEYGVVEQRYAERNPKDFAILVERYGHTAIAGKSYTTSAFLAHTLGDLSKYGSVLYHWGPATGRWRYNSQISWWAVPPEPQWSTEKSWEALECSVTYVPGQTEMST
jgi:hypothetical protein